MMGKGSLVFVESKRLAPPYNPILVYWRETSRQANEDRFSPGKASLVQPWASCSNSRTSIDSQMALAYISYVLGYPNKPGWGVLRSQMLPHVGQDQVHHVANVWRVSSWHLAHGRDGT